ncbi:MAG: DinB family protein [Cytophagales bacterium]|nr:DinB family protein [Cytophagales bacterium]
MDTSGWTKAVTRITLEVQSEFGSLSVDELNWKPSPHEWSVAQILDHLITINGTYFPILERVHDGRHETPWTGRLGFFVNMMGGLILQRVQPENQKKQKTLDIWAPSESALDGNILQRFVESQERLSDFIGRVQAGESI